MIMKVIHSYTVEHSPQTQTFDILPVKSNRIVSNRYFSFLSIPLDTNKAQITHRRSFGVDVVSEATRCIDTNAFNSALCSEYIYCLVLICIEYLIGFSRQVRILRVDNYKKVRMTLTHFMVFLLHVKHFIYFLRGPQ